MARTTQRITAGLLGAAVLALAAYGVALVLLVGTIAAQAPDPFVVDGDPCCGHPDTWGEVAWGAAWTLALALLDAVLLAAAVGLLMIAVRGRLPRLRRLALVPAAGVLVAAGALAVAIVPLLGHGRTPPPCDHYTFDRGGWASQGAAAHLDQALGLDHCGRLTSRTPSQVRTLLGPPGSQGRTGMQTYWRYAGLDVFFDGGRVSDVHAGAS